MCVVTAGTNNLTLACANSYSTFEGILDFNHPETFKLIRNFFIKCDYYVIGNSQATLFGKCLIYFGLILLILSASQGGWNPEYQFASFFCRYGSFENLSFETYYFKLFILLIILLK